MIRKKRKGVRYQSEKYILIKKEKEKQHTVHTKAKKSKAMKTVTKKKEKAHTQILYCKRKKKKVSGNQGVQW